MAEIHILPARLLSADQITRLSADLGAAQEQGVALGSRVRHIHANGEALLSMSHGLEGALDRLHQSLHQFGMQPCCVSRELSQLPVRRQS
ncbi:hypothetical protein [Methylobacterium longum]|uniref:Uncharacterized protein n=1 Tax=Methylobacterium longum TaxID=767694 RepID=A0ABT8AYX8_9HYPH|nr:hypothetical protein [Methylobacterium longum]MDN3575014.1 hypothetical protein [Methylobacterium longum]